jgi:uncharacterized membrane protein
VSDSLKKIITSTEGKLLVGAIVMIVLLTFYIFYCWIYDSRLYQSVVAIVVSDIIFGRAAGISIGYAMHLSTTHIIILNSYVEIITILVIYPLFVLSWNKLYILDSMQPHIQKIKDIATKYQPYIQKYGIIGLFGFVLFPFWMTGPIVGAVIGYLMGFSHIKTLSIVSLGTLIAVVCWSLFINEIKVFLSSINENAFLFIIFLIVVSTIVGYIYSRAKKEG